VLSRSCRTGALRCFSQRGAQPLPVHVMLDSRIIPSTAESGAWVGHDGHKRPKGSRVQMFSRCVQQVKAL
jgi:hypothetical protein